MNKSLFDFFLVKYRYFLGGFDFYIFFTLYHSISLEKDVIIRLNITTVHVQNI